MKVAVLSDIHGNLPALQAVVEHIGRWSPDIVVVDGEGHIVLVNGQAEVMFGYERPELLGQPIEKLARDALCMMHTGAGNHAVRVRLAAMLTGDTSLGSGIY